MKHLQENDLTIHRNIDLWLDNPKDPSGSWREAFLYGFPETLQGGEVPYDDYRIVKGCKCQIQLQCSPFEIHTRNLAVVFYRSGQPVRVLLASILSEVDTLMALALSTPHGGQTLATYLRNTLACRGQMVVLNYPTPPSAYSAGARYEPAVHPFGSSAQLFCYLKPKVVVQDHDSGKFKEILAEYLYDSRFRMQVMVETDRERFENLYVGALVCKNEEAIYPLLTTIS